MSGVIEDWVDKSLQRGDQVFVIIRNETTKEELRTMVNPQLIADLAAAKAIAKNKKRPAPPFDAGSCGQFMV